VGAGEDGEAEEERAASEALTADSADEEGRRGSSSSASSEAASTVSYIYSPPDEWQNKVAIKTCVSVVSADVAGGADDGKEEKPPRGGVDAAYRQRASGTQYNANPTIWSWTDVQCSVQSGLL